MKNFNTNTIKGEVDTISEILRKTREEKNIEIEKASKELGISKIYLNALESGNFDKIPNGVYSKNYFREYAQYLDLNDQELLNYFNSKVQPAVDLDTRGLFVKQAASNLTITIPKLIKNFVIIALLFGCFTYLGFYLKRITAPPELAIISPQHNIIINEYSVNIKGKTESEADIIINGEPVLCDPSGNFEKEINLKTGINEVTISAQKKYSRTNIINKQILVKDD